LIDLGVNGLNFSLPTCSLFIRESVKGSHLRSYNPFLFQIVVEVVVLPATWCNRIFNRGIQMSGKFYVIGFLAIHLLLLSSTSYDRIYSNTSLMWFGFMLFISELLDMERRSLLHVSNISFINIFNQQSIWKKMKWQ